MKEPKKEYTPQEAMEILSQCQHLRKSIDRLLIKTVKSQRPKLRIVDNGKT